MERENGYLNLDLLQSRIKIKEYALRKKGAIYAIKLDDTDYYFKECSYQDAITELVVSEMLSKIDIPNVKYDLTQYKHKKGVTSRSFKKDGFRYISGREILDNYIKALEDECKKAKGTPFGEISLEEYERYKNDVDAKHTVNNLELIMHAVEYHVKDRDDAVDEKYKILNTIVTYHLADILLSNQDRNRSNWVIEESDDYIGVVPAFDNADSFKDKNWMALRVQPIGDDLHPTNTYTEFEEFIARSDKRYLERFAEMREKLSIDTLEECIKIVEGKIKCEIRPDVKKKIIDFYRVHLEKIDGIFQKRCKKSDSLDDSDFGNR